MKSQTLTNVLLVVIAVGTLGNFWQGQAGHNPASAYGETRVTVANRGSSEAIPVCIVGTRMQPWEGIPTSSAISLSDWKGLPSELRVTQITLWLVAGYGSPGALNDSLVEDFLRMCLTMGMLTEGEAEQVRKLVAAAEG